MGAWLAGGVGDGDTRIELLDSLGRVADVSEPGTGRVHRFEHLYGCWRRVDGG